MSFSLWNNVHTPLKAYPTLADGVQLAATTTEWELGTITEVVPANTIASDFSVLAICVETVSAASVYELVLYAGADDTEIGRVRFAGICDCTRMPRHIHFCCPIVAANSRIRARLASDSEVADTVDLALQYITH